MEDLAVTGNKVSEKVLADFDIFTQSLLLSLAKSKESSLLCEGRNKPQKHLRRYNYLKGS